LFHKIIEKIIGLIFLFIDKLLILVVLLTNESKVFYYHQHKYYNPDMVSNALVFQHQLLFCSCVGTIVI